MKEFKNLVEAINYHKKCCLCSGPMDADFHGNAIRTTYYQDYQSSSQCIEINLSDNVDCETDDILTINLMNNRVSLQQRKRSHYEPYVVGTNLLSYPSRISTHGYPGTLFESIGVSCYQCHKFNYVIQIIMDLEKENRITHLSLNSEFIAWEDAVGTHEIKNWYGSRHTNYTCCPNLYTRGKTCELPLISLNLNNPSETVARIRKLLPFA